MSDSPQQSSGQRGFTLIELSIVLLVVGLLLGTIMMPMATQFRIRETRNAQQQIEEVRQALIGFAQSQGRLPCPDTDLDGIENPPPPITTPPAVCRNTLGFLPYATIGLPATDPWGHLYVYRVASEFINFVRPGIPCVGNGVGDNQLGLCDFGDINIFTRGDSPAVGIQAKNRNPFTGSPPPAPAVLPGAAAVILSFGPNGFCGTTPDGNQLSPPVGACPIIDHGAPTYEDRNDTTDPPLGPPDEIENSDADAYFVSRSYTNGGTACNDTVEGQPFCEFDDLVVWIPTSLLMVKLIDAGQLP